MTKPLILVTNDDGILSTGIRLLSEALATVGDVMVVAPDGERSGVSHGISVTVPLRAKEVSAGRYAVSGMPADAVILGILELCPRIPDLVVSGINHGANLASDVFYSGTVAAAREAALREIPAVAVSQKRPAREEQLPNYLEQCATFAAQFCEMLLSGRAPIAPGTLLNINAPAAETRTYCHTRLASALRRNRVRRQIDPRGVSYYWMEPLPEPDTPEPGSDCWALEKGHFSITPLGTDATVDPATSWNVEGYEQCAKPVA